ncbi:dipeptidyl peptidase 1-like isoform X2 [Mytilus californianus]|uniref:dipeptidyl peptidase 1-like isoform X2 n=1 Tax=Mytilus californianus TaxID=6549 RepID=UPI002247CA04|nr:dipeptidyl peptidase 1-like isoform X2 [Mytilus californianus]
MGILYALQCFLFLLSIIASVNGDTPANCTYEDLRGEWLFKVGSGGNDRTLKCDSFAMMTTLKVKLYFPDYAVDQYGNKGFWTLIYNQGFEVVIAGRKYFAFSMFKKDGKNITSMCDQTFPGWSHDTFDRDWSCFSGMKMSSVAPKTYQLPDNKRLYGDILYKTDHSFIKKINQHQKSWQAVHYPEYEKITVEDMIKRAGGRKSRIIGRPKPARPTREQTLKAQSLPDSFDWRNVGGMNYVSPIRNQLSCGSCYAFGSLAMNEARVRIMTNGTKTPVFSTQDIVECSEYSQGCDGGFPYLIGGKYAEDFGLVAESCNPYTGKDGQCKTKTSCPRQYATKYEYIGGFYGACNEELMMENLVKNGPIAVSFMVYADFMHYKSGIYQHTTLTNGFNPFEITNHVVLVVGYGYDSEIGHKYWLVKNSWGTKWGEDGFFRIMRGVDECSLESIAVQSFPIL